jgi:hypothetical protein
MTVFHQVFIARVESHCHPFVRILIAYFMRLMLNPAKFMKRENPVLMLFAAILSKGILRQK